VRLITDAGNGCTDTTEQNLIVESLYRLYWPSIFSPNGDGVNDIFLPGGDLTGLQDYKILIVSRWGSSVFESANPSDGWNGKSQNTGAELPAGVYFYRATMKDVLGSALQYEGTITLIR
jgi:gliding motility-associated-like protein